MRSVFFGTCAFIGRVDGPSQCALWTDEPVEHGFDRRRLIEVDLDRTPEAAAAERIDWDAVEVDDCVPGPGGRLGGTSIGPRWPEMQLVGAVYFEESRWRRLPPKLRFPRPPRDAQARDYEYTRVVYWPHVDDPRAGRRYAGFHVELLEMRGSLAHVVIYPPGASLESDVRGSSAWIDLADVDQCDASPDSLSTIGTGAAPRAGSLFLAIGDMFGTKLPPARGPVFEAKLPPIRGPVFEAKLPPLRGPAIGLKIPKALGEAISIKIPKAYGDGGFG